MNSAVKILQADPRVVGIALGGSYLYGEMDEFSDLDFVIAVDPAALAEVMADRLSIAKNLGNLLTAFTGEHVGEPRLLVCLYDEPLLHVDLKFVSLDDVSKRIEDPVILYQQGNVLAEALSGTVPQKFMPDLQWNEDRFWIWVHYTAGKIGRGELFEALEAVSFIRQTVVGPMLLKKNGKQARGVRNIERDAPEAMPVLLSTVAGHSRESLIQALSVLIDLYRQLREILSDGNLALRGAAECRAVEYLEEIAGRNVSETA